ncbi:MAG: tRNA/rRNA methyltransferase [Cyclobacteriaceae bacterium]|nr:tRNA/rRNA methyltransferase [Cyclobacteriaceae bacterium]
MSEIQFVLVEPAVAGNVGACARALKTMGYSHLTLVNPCDHLSVEAKTLAHGSHDVLEKARLVDNLQKAIENVDLVIGTTANIHRKARKDFYNPEQIMEHISKNNDTIKTVAIVFGREESGLSNEEIRMCDILSSIPIKTRFPSLNLAQSVMLYAYLCARSGFRDSEILQDTPKDSVRTVLKKQVAEILQKLEFKKEENIYNLMMERLNMTGSDDAHLILSFLKRLKGFLKS